MSYVLQGDIEDPIMFGPKQLVSSSKLVRNLSSYLDMAQKSPIFVEREQEIEAVLISIEDYRNLLREEEKVEKLYQYVLSIRRFVEQLQSKDKIISTAEVLHKLGLLSSEAVKG